MSDPTVLPILVVCAAIRNKQGEIICGARHYDQVMRAQMARSGGRDVWSGAEHGFIDQIGTFLTREEAYKIATINSQIRRRCGGDHDKLFSENLY